MDNCSGKKPELGMLSLQEKKKFYRQELFEGNDYLRKHLLTLLLIFGLIQIPNFIIHIIYINVLTVYERSIIPVSFLFFLLCIGVSFITRFRKDSSKIFNMQFIMLLLANLFAVCCITCRLYFYIKRVSAQQNLVNIIDGVIICTSCLSFSKLLDVFNPLWYFKITGPVAYFVAWIVSSHQIDSEYVYLTYLSGIFGMIGVIMTECIQASFRWNLFVKKTDHETWNAIHKLILNKVPSPIAVLSIKGDHTYSNREFNRLCENQFELFCKRLVNLKRREKCIVTTEEEKEESDSRLDTEVKQKDTTIKTSQLPKDFHFKQKIEDLTKLIELITDMMKKEKINDDDCFTFDGNLVNERTNTKESFEITFSFMIEYQKIILILRNTTDHVRLINLESASQYKDKLLASVSHELRTPLNGNLSLIETTIHHPDVPQVVKEKLLIPAHRSGKLLLHLINDILDYSQIGAKKLRLNFQELSIVDTIKNCYQLLELQAKKKGLDLKLFIDEQISTFTTDHDRVTQIILNLLSNALKFTFTGSISLTAKLISASNIQISVKDTGIGIKSEDLKKLFREFTRIEGPDQAHFNARGVGLGLTIANKLARRLGYQQGQLGIKVESVYGQGSCFSFIITEKKRESEVPLVTKLVNKDWIARQENVNRENKNENSFRNSSLPLLTSTEEFNIENSARDLNASIPVFRSKGIISLKEIPMPKVTDRKTENVLKGKRKILVVDDEPFNILAIESFLDSYKIQVDTAFNGKDAVDKVIKLSYGSGRHYDLILMDCQMPVMNGYEATKTLIKMMESEINETPIIGCTAFNSNEILNLCYEAGMVQVIEKPLSKAKIDQIVKSFLFDKA